MKNSHKYSFHPIFAGAHHVSTAEHFLHKKASMRSHSVWGRGRHVENARSGISFFRVVASHSHLAPVSQRPNDIDRIHRHTHTRCEFIAGRVFFLFFFLEYFEVKENGIVPWDSGELSIFMQMLEPKWGWKMGFFQCTNWASEWQNRTKYDPLTYIRSALRRRKFVKFNFEEFNLYLRMKMRLWNSFGFFCALSAALSFCSWKMKFTLMVRHRFVSCRMRHQNVEPLIPHEMENSRKYTWNCAIQSSSNGRVWCLRWNVWWIWSTLDAHRSHGNWIESVRRTNGNQCALCIDDIRETHQDGYRLLYPMLEHLNSIYLCFRLFLDRVFSRCCCCCSQCATSDNE